MKALLCSRSNSCAFENGDSQNKGADAIFATLEESVLAKEVDCLWSLCPFVVVPLTLDSSISIAELHPAATDVLFIMKQR